MNVSVSCGSKMAAFGRLEDKGKETVPFIRKSNSLPRIPQYTRSFVSLVRTATGPFFAAKEAAK